MSEFSGLTFDWDNVSIDDGIVQAELEWLCEEFGEDYVWYRESSSKTGLHVLIGQIELHPITLEFNIVPLKMGVEKQLEYRETTQIECRGRVFFRFV